MTTVVEVQEIQAELTELREARAAQAARREEAEKKRAEVEKELRELGVEDPSTLPAVITELRQQIDDDMTTLREALDD